METDAVVIGMGGFGGRDDTPSTDQLQRWVDDGTLRFVVSSPSGGPAMPQQLGGAGAAVEKRQQWIEQHCTVVDPSAYGGKPNPDTGSPGGPIMMNGGSNTLYQCGGG